MPVMCMISCRILEDEILWVLENDPSIDEVAVVENGNCRGLLAKLKTAGFPHKVLPQDEIPKLSPAAGDAPGKYTVLVYMLELALHERPEKLKNKVYETVEMLASGSSGILLFYGLCGNVLGNVEEDFASRLPDCPVRILRDDACRVVDDCIGATLGGSAQYLKVLKSVSNVGTYLFTPMYSAAWEEFLHVDKLHKDPEKALKMMKKTHEITGYGRVAKLKTGLSYTENFDENIMEFADLFGFEVIELEGNQKVFDKCYRELKAEICN
ncbi:DUF1638 domain-containing protein [Methanosarcina sp. KYL-1]|uniref:DUF1638 domain-containing protein n=1 Tax=Methanosarcina sp. KYL-1 TaxID=2602068 RepID=UPI002101CE14|nr:DUF1638 domain-containing protein [Methanosarcina sp. KYL-1]MCQ1534915.1 DUF1638 domain-containing protein [Methanosarcina sp. KYL-1]